MADVVIKSFINRLCLGLPKFRTLSKKEQFDLAALIWQTGSYQREHLADPSASSISYKELTKRFGRGRFDEINDLCKAFEVSTNWHHASGETRRYWLTEKTQEIKSSYLHDGRPRLSSLIRADGKRMRSLPAAIASKDRDGVSILAWANAGYLKNTCPVDIQKLNRLYTLLGNLTGPGHADLFITDIDAEAVSYDRDMAQEILRLANIDLTGKGFVMLRYAEAATGRLYAHGINLQTIPRLVRQAALHGLWDYDIANCHFAIFHQMAARYGFNASNIEAYLADKSGTRSGIAERTGIGVGAAKTCLIVTMYGARTSHWFKAVIPDSIGQDAATRLYVDPVFCGIYEDIKVGRKSILAGSPKRPRTILNAVGKSIQLKRPAKDILAHLIQGIEVQALRAAQALYRDNICLLLHDGFVSLRKLSIPRIEAAMKNATSYELRLVEEKIQLPPDLGFSNS